jgi:hypothetical protein
MLIYNKGGWDLLPPEIQEKGQQLFEKAKAEGIKTPEFQPPSTSPNLSLPEYTALLSDALGLGNLQSDFWVLVIRIAYIMISVEKDPTVAAHIRQMGEENSRLDSYLREMMGE